MGESQPPGMQSQASEAMGPATSVLALNYTGIKWAYVQMTGVMPTMTGTSV